jgi:hypothetical protein
VDGRARADIQDRDSCNVVLRPIRMIDIKMSTGNLREQLHDAENKPREKPIRIIENDGEPWQQRRRDEREQCDRENEEGNRDDD